jgi:hypothetical protein
MATGNCGGRIRAEAGLIGAALWLVRDEVKTNLHAVANMEAHGFVDESPQLPQCRGCDAEARQGVSFRPPDHVVLCGIQMDRESYVLHVQHPSASQKASSLIIGQPDILYQDFAHEPSWDFLFVMEAQQESGAPIGFECPVRTVLANDLIAQRLPFENPAQLRPPHRREPFHRDILRAIRAIGEIGPSALAVATRDRLHGRPVSLHKVDEPLG